MANFHFRLRQNTPAFGQKGFWNRQNGWIVKNWPEAFDDRGTLSFYDGSRIVIVKFDFAFLLSWSLARKKGTS